MNELLTTKEACAFLKIGRLTLYKLIKAKELSGCKIGRGWRFERKNLDSFIEEKTQENNKAINTVSNKEAV